MTTIYLINNNLTMNLSFPNIVNYDNKKEKQILSIEGENESKKLAANSFLQNVEAIYSSPYVMCLETAKYLANELELIININPLLSERKVGNLDNTKISMLNMMQENNFDYKLPTGESFNEARLRMKKIIREILIANKNKEVAIFTHNTIITSFLSEYCEKGFNLDNRLILNYNDESIIDGTKNDIDVIKVDYNNDEVVNISRII